MKRKKYLQAPMARRSGHVVGFPHGFFRVGITKHQGRRELRDYLHCRLPPILKLRKLRPERRMTVHDVGGHAFSLEVLGPIPGLSQADPPP